MRIDNRTLQARLAALGHNPGPIDGLVGRRTEAALVEALAEFGGSEPRDLFDVSGLHSIRWHWTAGAYGVNELEADSYNRLVDELGVAHDGQFPPAAQANYAPGRAASHTLNANSGAIGVAVDCMAGAVERPFNPGKAPMTEAQVDGLVKETARLCRKIWIPVTRWSVLSHAEVQPTLGIRQRFKWDITWLPGMDRPGDPIEVGDRLRAMVRQEMGL